MTITVTQPVSVIPTEHEMLVFQTMSKQAVASKMYKNIGDEAGVLMIMLAARELGIPAMQALNGGINIINGKVELSARLMNAMMRRAGIRISIKSSTDTECTLYAVRPEGDTATVSYSLKDAQMAGLVKQGGGWTRNPKDMCFARAISRLARQIAPDIIGGCYVEGEIKAVDAVPVVPQDLPEAEVTTTETGEDLKAKFFRITGIIDTEMFNKYLSTVSAHFQWTEEETLKRFMDDKDIVEKYAAWKLKQK